MRVELGTCGDNEKDAVLLSKSLTPTSRSSTTPKSNPNYKLILKMRKGENIRDEISFNGVDGLKSPEFIQALRVKAFSDDKYSDSPYMAVLAAMCVVGPALEWFENLGDDVQSDWSLLRRALLTRFPVSDTGPKENDIHSLIFTGENPEECDNFVRSVRKHSHAEGKTRDDEWTAHYAASCMTGKALQWHTKLSVPIRNDWIQLERALLTCFPEPPLPAPTPAGRVFVEHWERSQAPSFLPTSLETWLREARERLKAYDEVGPGGLTSVHWLLVERGERIPDCAIETGVDSCGDPLYSARAWLKDGLHTGKCGRHISGAHLFMGSKEMIDITPYEVLVGDASAVCWINNPSRICDQVGRSPPTKMKPFYAIEGGLREDGIILLLMQSYKKGNGWQPGKIGICWEMGGILLDHKVFWQRECRILAWA